MCCEFGQGPKMIAYFLHQKTRSVFNAQRLLSADTFCVLSALNCYARVVEYQGAAGFIVCLCQYVTWELLVNILYTCTL